jgi:hypothetical protein
MTSDKVIQNATARLGKGTPYDRESNEFVDRKVASSNTFTQRTGNNKNTENNSLEHITCAL